MSDRRAAPLRGALAARARRAIACASPLRGALAARARRAIACAALVAALPGCSVPGALVTTPGDYAAYRATRVSRTFEARLAAASSYLERYPEGAYARKVRAYLARAEPVYYAVKRRSADGLRAYLVTLPRGAFREDAVRRLRQLEERGEDVLLSRAAAETEARLAREQAERRRLHGELAAWLRRFLDADVWGRPFSQAPADVIVPFSLSLPAPSCAPAPALPDALVCTKRIELPFVVRGDDGREIRTAALSIAVAQDAAGRPLEITLGGPDLFTRLEEAHSARAIAEGDAAGRINGIVRAVELARGAFQAKVAGDAACARPAVAPVVLHLECGGARLVARAAEDEGGDDTYAITVAPPDR